MQTLLTISYILVCFFLILVVLLQSGKGGGMGSAFGGTSQTVFGGAGAGNVLTRLTAVGAALFMVLSATMAYISSSSESALERAQQDIEAREAARSGAAAGGDGDSPLEPADPAGMSDLDALEADDEEADDAEEPTAAPDDGLGDPPPPAEADDDDAPAAAPAPAEDGLGDAPDLEPDQGAGPTDGL
jgi:preprotein translocase subunit SecG